MADCKQSTTTTGYPVGKFVLISPASMLSILKVLEERLPRSANVYNIALYVSRHPDESAIGIYTINGDISSSSAWVVIVQRERGLHVLQTISISAPPNPTITDDIKQAFLNMTLIQWDKSYMFNAIDREISPLIMEISSKINPATNCFPNYYYTISREDALNQEITPAEENGVIIQPLDLDKGADFITRSWKYSDDQTIKYTTLKISQYPSVGIYIYGHPISAVLMHSDLLVGMLTTDPSHRNKGYALLCMKTLLLNLAKEGNVPSSCVEQHNIASMKFHVKCGMVLSHECDFIKYKP